jgi:Predicted transcriptional regulators
MKMERVSIRLKNLRQDHDFTQKQVANYLGIPQQTYSNYERAIREIPSHFVVRLAALYHVSTDYVLGLTGEHNIPYDLEAAFTADIPLKSVLIHLYKLEPQHRIQFLRFLFYLTRK